MVIENIIFTYIFECQFNYNNYYFKFIRDGEF